MGSMCAGVAELLHLGDLLDRAGGAHLAAEHARGLAVADAGDEDGRPQALDAALEEGRVEGVVGAHLHALRAADAALDEVALLDRAGRPDDAVVVVGVEGVAACGDGSTAPPATADARRLPAVEVVLRERAATAVRQSGT
jgi:hypothetical protein